MGRSQLRVLTRLTVSMPSRCIKTSTSSLRISAYPREEGGGQRQDFHCRLLCQGSRAGEGKLAPSDPMPRLGVRLTNSAETVPWNRGTRGCVNSCYGSRLHAPLPMPVRKTRNVSLTPELEALVDRKVASGRYRSASEVVRAALRLLDERERHLDEPSANQSHTPATVHADC